MLLVRERWRKRYERVSISIRRKAAHLRYLTGKSRPHGCGAAAAIMRNVSAIKQVKWRSAITVRPPLPCRRRSIKRRDVTKRRPRGGENIVANRRLIGGAGSAWRRQARRWAALSAGDRGDALPLQRCGQNGTARGYLLLIVNANGAAGARAGVARLIFGAASRNVFRAQAASGIYLAKIKQLVLSSASQIVPRSQAAAWQKSAAATSCGRLSANIAGGLAAGAQQRVPASGARCGRPCAGNLRQYSACGASSACLASKQQRRS